MKTQLLNLLLLGMLCPSFTFAQSLESGPQVLTIHSEADDTEQPYAIYLPFNFDENKKYPFVMMLHGAGSNHRLALKRVFGKSNKEGESDVEASRYFEEWKDVNYIVAAPFARGTAGYQGISENDVWAVLEDVKSRFNIDENRTYLTGLSMGGGGTLWIGLTKPDVWAAIAPVCPAPPAGTDKLAGNAFNLPVHFFHGDADPVVPVEGSRTWVKNMEAQGVDVKLKEYPGVKHDSWINAYADGQLFDLLDQYERNQFPKKINFTTPQLKYNKAYWVEINQKQPGELARFEAEINADDKLSIQTENILAFTLNLNDHPDVGGKRLELNIDGTNLSLNAANNMDFTMENGKWANKKTTFEEGIKTKGQEGPIYNAFSSRHVYVYGTEGNPSADELAKRRAIATQAAQWSNYRGEFLGRIMFFPRILSDKEVRESDLKDANLILFGTKETNKLISDFSDELPFHFNGPEEEYGLFYIYPKNGKYIAISSGLPWWANVEDRGLPFVSITHRQLPEFKDFILFKNTSKNIVSSGYFDNEWKLDPETKKTLANSGVLEIK